MMLLFTLFGKECRRVLRSWAYLVFVVIVMLFYHVQIGTTVSDQIRGAQADSGTVQTETYNPLRCPTPERRGLLARYTQTQHHHSSTLRRTTAAYSRQRR